MTKTEFINYYVEHRETKAMIDSLGEMYDTVLAPMQVRIKKLEAAIADVDKAIRVAETMVLKRYTKDEVIIAFRDELVRTNAALQIGGLTAIDMQYVETLHIVLK